MRLDRLLVILTVLLHNERVTAPELAERFEVNRRTMLNKLHANSDAVISMREPVIIALVSHYKGQLMGKIEIIKRAVLETRLIDK